jgi:alpha/beta superfamily hydrolase
MGTRDEFTSISKFRSKFKTLTGPAEKVEFEGNHFWFGEEEQLLRAIQQWLSSKQTMGSMPAETLNPLDVPSVTPPVL